MVSECDATVNDLDHIFIYIFIFLYSLIKSCCKVLWVLWNLIISMRVAYKSSGCYTASYIYWLWEFALISIKNTLPVREKEINSMNIRSSLSIVFNKQIWGEGWAENNMRAARIVCHANDLDIIWYFAGSTYLGIYG